MRSRTQTSGHSKRKHARPTSPFPTQSGSNPASARCEDMPFAISSSSSTISTFVTSIIVACAWTGWGRGLVKVW